MAGGLLGIAVSGLRASQTAISTTGNNIANAGTEGYSRQRVVTESRAAPSPNTAGFIGTGVVVQSIDRIFNQFANEQLRIDTTLSSELNTYSDQISQINNLLADTSAGLSSHLESFFSALQNGSDDPTSLPIRELIVSEAESLSDQFNLLHSRIETIENGVDDALQLAVSNINSLASNLAELNTRISNTNGAPNDLLDERDRTLRSLAELISIQTFDQGNGQVNVVIGTGQSLVVGSSARSLALESSQTNPTQLDIVIDEGGSTQSISSLISGGQVGGLLDFRRESVDTTFNTLGQIALGLVENVNQLHERGVDLEGEFGRLFFNDINADELAAARVFGNRDNSVSDNRVLKLNINDSSQLIPSDYRLDIDRQGVYTIERVSDRTEVATGLFTGAFPLEVEFDGLALVFESGRFEEGDTFVLQAFKNGARDIERAIDDPSALAFASPLLTDANIGNRGTATVSQGELVTRFDPQGELLPLFANSGEISPPLIVKFTSPTNYDILNNSNPANPVQLEPPIRNQRFIPGASNVLFSDDPGETVIVAQGDALGLPDGRGPLIQANLQVAAAVAPAFTVTDFNNPSNQFAFDLEIANTVGNNNDGVFTVVINNPGIVDNNALVSTINNQLSGSDAQAYITQDGHLSFRLESSGFGDISLNNFDANPGGLGASVAPGVANNLLGFDIEGSTFTTVNDADGFSGEGLQGNGYTQELVTLTRTSNQAGEPDEQFNIFTNLNASARSIASELNNVAGVSVNASTYLEVTDFNVGLNEPLQITLNGEDLVLYDEITNTLNTNEVPDPATDLDAFNRFLAQRINANVNPDRQGIYALAGQDPQTGLAELRVFSREGDDLTIDFIAAAGQTIGINDGENPNVNLTALAGNVKQSISVGGRVDVTLAQGLTLSTTPEQSRLFGDTTAEGFAQSNYYGIQVELSGSPEIGDTFTLDFNRDAERDNRNVLALSALELSETLNGGNSTFRGAYGILVEDVGIDTSAARINSTAAEQVLRQSEEIRNSISGVNLDEEAADLIRFEQYFSANAQVISVARDLFDRLINSF